MLKNNIPCEKEKTRPQAPAAHHKTPSSTIHTIKDAFRFQSSIVEDVIVAMLPKNIRNHRSHI